MNSRGRLCNWAALSIVTALSACGGNDGGDVEAYFNYSFSFSPDGKAITFIDRGPGPAREDAAQIVILDIATGKRTQVTHLPAVRPYPPNIIAPDIFFASFSGNEKIVFHSPVNPADPTGVHPDGLNPEGGFRFFSVKRDGTRLSVLPDLFALPGSQIVPVFSITQPVANVASLGVPGTPENPSPFFPPGSFQSDINEVFVVSPGHGLQLTNFRRVDTAFSGASTDGQRVFFGASADRFGTNPSENCQIFSIDALGTDLRQLTQFRAADHSAIGCFLGIPGQPGCSVGGLLLDAEIGTLIFQSTCDPLGTNPKGGEIFMMRLDGTGLRQLTSSRGVVSGADGSVDVELPGVLVYSAQ